MLQSKEQIQGITSFLYQDVVRSAVSNSNQIAEVGVLILTLEKLASNISFWTRLGLMRLGRRLRIDGIWITGLGSSLLQCQKTATILLLSR